MKNNNTVKHLSLVDTTTGEVADGEVTLRFAKRYIPGHWQIFRKHQSDLYKLSFPAYKVFSELAKSMHKGNKVEIGEIALGKQVGLSQSTVHRAMKQLKAREIIRGSKGHYIVNPKYALNGGASYYIQAHTDYSLG